MFLLLSFVALMWPWPGNCARLPAHPNRIEYMYTYIYIYIEPDMFFHLQGLYFQEVENHILVMELIK